MLVMKAVLRDFRQNRSLIMKPSTFFSQQPPLSFSEDRRKTCRIGDTLVFDCPHVSEKGDHLTVKWLHNSFPTLTIKDGKLAVTEEIKWNTNRDLDGYKIMSFVLRDRWTFYYSEVDNNFNLRITDVQSLDQGLWECVVETGLKTAKNDVMVSMQENDVITSTSKSVEKDDSFVVISADNEETSTNSGRRWLSLPFLLIASMLCNLL